MTRLLYIEYDDTKKARCGVNATWPPVSILGIAQR